MNLFSNEMGGGGGGAGLSQHFFGTINWEIKIINIICQISKIQDTCNIKKHLHFVA